MAQSVAAALVLAACAHAPAPSSRLPAGETSLGWVAHAFRLDVRVDTIDRQRYAERNTRWTLERSAAHAFVGHAVHTWTPRADPSHATSATLDLTLPELAVDAVLERIAAVASSPIASSGARTGACDVEPRPAWSLTIADGLDTWLALEIRVSEECDPPLARMRDPHGTITLDGTAMREVLAELRELLPQPEDPAP